MAALNLDAYQEAAATFERALLDSLTDVAPRHLRDAALHYPAAGGKRLRPLITLIAADACATPGAQNAWRRALPAAVAVELVHTFSLVHDDIMDQDALRRGLPTVHAKWDEATAILAGDVQFAIAFEVLVNGLDPEAALPVIREVASAVRVLCEGQAFDMAFESRTPSVHEYVDMIRGKTGRLFETAARAGALALHAPAAHVDALGAYGNALGLAFQLRDDVIDVTQETATRGKARYADLRRGKQTFLVLHALERGSADEQAAVRAVLGVADAPEDALKRAVDALETSGALDAARAFVSAHTKKALAALAVLPDSVARGRLTHIAEWASGREV